MSDEFLTVSELNQYIKDVINAGFPQALWVCGEIQGFNRNKDKRHIFFELVEKEPNSQDIKARIGLVIFGGKKLQIQNILKKSENAFTLKDDIEVKFACRIDFYAPHGAVRLIVESIDPTYTLGKLAQQRQRLIAELKQKGVLDKNKALELPIVPLNIGLITADDSAAYNDFLSEIKKSQFGFQLFLRNAIMQGKNAEEDIARAIKELQKIKDLDVIVITRGGGSIADLSCFDSKLIAETMADSRVPILTGIGHEINISVTDLAAHTFAKTPTAIAQFLVERTQSFLDSLDEKQNILIELSQERIRDQQQRLKSLAIDLQHNTQHFLKTHNEKIIRLSEMFVQKPQVILNDYRKNLIMQWEQLAKSTKQRIDNESLKLKGYKQVVDIVHPVNTLKRGFSITRNKQGKAIKGVKGIQEDDELSTELAEGVIVSEVLKVK